MTCGCTYVNNCLICTQNAKYNESLMNDQRTSEQSSSNETNFDSFDIFNGQLDLPALSERNEPTASITSTITTSNDELSVSPEELRILRVEHFQKKKHIFRIHRMKVATDLINHFIENKVCIPLCVYVYVACF